MKKSKEEIINIYKARIGEEPTEEDISFLEDLDDSITDEDADYWKTKYEENDRQWKEKYISRFGNTEKTEESVIDDSENDVELKTEYSELFKED